MFLSTNLPSHSLLCMHSAVVCMYTYVNVSLPVLLSLIVVSLFLKTENIMLFALVVQ